MHCEVSEVKNSQIKIEVIFSNPETWLKIYMNPPIEPFPVLGITTSPNNVIKFTETIVLRMLGH